MARLDGVGAYHLGTSCASRLRATGNVLSSQDSSFGRRRHSQSVAELQRSKDSLIFALLKPLRPAVESYNVIKKFVRLENVSRATCIASDLDFKANGTNDNVRRSQSTLQGFTISFLTEYQVRYLPLSLMKRDRFCGGTFSKFGQQCLLSTRLKGTGANWRGTFRKVAA